MKKENNYPIAYAVLELKEKGGYIDSYADITQGFIASKCYVLESSVVYNSDGSCKFVHKVVFPYNDIKGFKAAIKNGSHNIGDKEEVKYDAYGNAFPVSIVTELYDSFEVAKLADNSSLSFIKSFSRKLIKTFISKPSSFLPGSEYSVKKSNLPSIFFICPELSLPLNVSFSKAYLELSLSTTFLIPSKSFLSKLTHKSSTP